MEYFIIELVIEKINPEIIVSRAAVLESLIPVTLLFNVKIIMEGVHWGYTWQCSGLFLSLCPSITPGRTLSYMQCQEWSTGWLCASNCYTISLVLEILLEQAVKKSLKIKLFSYHAKMFCLFTVQTVTPMDKVKLFGFDKSNYLGCSCVLYLPTFTVETILPNTIYAEAVSIASLVKSHS